MRRRRHRRRRHQDECRRRRHRGRPCQRGADPRPHHRRASRRRASWARRATTCPAPAACAGWSTPSTAPSTTSTASPTARSPIAAEVDGEIVAGVVVNVSPVVGRTPRRRGAARPATASPSAYVRPRRSRSGWSLTGFGYRRRRPRPPGRVRGRPAPEVRDIRRWVRAPWTCATWPRAALDAYVEEGASPWDSPPAGWSLREAGGRFELLEVHHGARRRPSRASWSAPQRRLGLAASAALPSAGFLAGRVAGIAGAPPLFSRRRTGTAAPRAR